MANFKSTSKHQFQTMAGCYSSVLSTKHSRRSLSSYFIHSVYVSTNVEKNGYDFNCTFMFSLHLFALHFNVIFSYTFDSYNDEWRVHICLWFQFGIPGIQMPVFVLNSCESRNSMMFSFLISIIKSIFSSIEMCLNEPGGPLSRLLLCMVTCRILHNI